MKSICCRDSLIEKKNINNNNNNNDSTMISNNFRSQKPSNVNKSTKSCKKKEKKFSAICKHNLSEHNSKVPFLSEQFHVLTKRSNGLDLRKLKYK